MCVFVISYLIKFGGAFMGILSFILFIVIFGVFFDLFVRVTWWVFKAILGFIFLLAILMFLALII